MEVKKQTSVIVEMEQVEKVLRMTLDYYHIKFKLNVCLRDWVAAIFLLMWQPSWIDLPVYLIVGFWGFD